MTGNWQKDPCTTKAVRKIHTCLGRKGRKVIGSGPVPLGEDSEETGNYTGGHLLWRISSTSHRLDSQSWGLMRKRQTPFTGLRTTGTERLWRTWTLLIRSMHTLVWPVGSAERGLL